jgi:hypothetical protein
MAFKPAPNPAVYTTPGRFTAVGVATLAIGGLAVRSQANGQKVVAAPAPPAPAVTAVTVGYPL